ncbi:MAG: chemotaxis protein CheD, partial [Devosia sp.]|nr:chemotaxis protein CheD [Devosia sp.]
SQDLGGTYARRVLFKPASGRAFVKRLDSDAGASVARAEIALVRRRVVVAVAADNIELF